MNARHPHRRAIPNAHRIVKGGDPISPVAGPTPVPVTRTPSSKAGWAFFVGHELYKLRCYKRQLYVTAGLACLFGVGSLASIGLAHSGLIINLTPSMPIGLYHLSPLPHRLHDGMIVCLCPPSPASNPAMAQAVRARWLLTSPSSTCPAHLVPFIKRIGATPGQTVSLTMNDTSIDGHRLPGTAIKRFAKNGQPIIHQKPGIYHMKLGQVWAWDNSSPWAYDSRYWGPLPVANILKQARPVLTW